MNKHSRTLTHPHSHSFSLISSQPHALMRIFTHTNVLHYVFLSQKPKKPKRKTTLSILEGLIGAPGSNDLLTTSYFATASWARIAER